MTCFELLFFFINVMCGLLLGLYGYSTGGPALAFVYFVLGSGGMSVLLWSIGEASGWLHRRKLPPMRCECGECDADEFVYRDVEGTIVTQYKCGRMYVREDGKIVKLEDTPPES